jgi:ParB family chromosome partitioning protein
LNPIEEAHAYQQLLDEFALTQAEVSRRVGKSRSEVANKVGLLKLPALVQQSVSDGQLSYGHARALNSLPSVEAQLNLMRLIIKKDLSVRQTEAIAQKLKQEEKPQPKARPRSAPEVRALEEAFQTSLGTRVQLQKNSKGAGRLVIHFYSDEDLQALYENIVGHDD